MHFSPLPYIRKYIREKLDEKVASGPYKGMTFPKMENVDCYEAKLMGIYEKELHPTLNEFSGLNLQSLTIIGAAEGYHAIGLASITGLKPVCFEENSSALQNLEELASINKKDLSVHGEFTDTSELRQPPGIVFMDIEGTERTVLTQERLKEWQLHHLVIEIHSPGILESLTEKAAEHFNTNWIPCQRRTVEDYPFRIPFKRILSRWWNVPVQEWRGDSLGWLILNPLSDRSGQG